MKVLDVRTPSLQVFDSLESEVRSYCRSFPAVFTKAQGYKLWDDDNREYIDFFAGAGALNYGHNNRSMKRKLLDYIQQDGVTHSLDMATKAKEQFLKKFHQVILEPRGLAYKVMFPGPTGANTVESALKLARKVTGRSTVFSFTNAFHGMTLGALSVTGNKFKRQGAGIPLHHTVSMPYDGYLGPDIDTLDYMENYMNDSGSGVSRPAAIIVETVQGEGGINEASNEWLQRLERICRSHEIVLIVDDVQMGCGRTGTFFSFERAGITPDIVCLSKSIGGYGLPMALTLIRPDLDIWEPGEHNGTFRGNNLAFITAAEALDYWSNERFTQEIMAKGKVIRSCLEELVAQYPELQGTARGRGLMQGIAFGIPGMAERLCARAFARGLIMETSGTDSEVAKIMPPLTIDDTGLLAGLDILRTCVKELAEER
ncbi:diaminobutyrate--2-oxoglutarate transaminase [Paenibacillus dendritiformis]|uniref:Diaminobutyrate--2-oxoglutarate transaminase n=1 Tax=Paenibacillus dendritiformis C454 TaxID=1131935 RepID=H3SPK3_9BACL|nr:diaminobutyrate--2-oxoglutarate transaminase [Paenibacillus dendritiformis]EHQ59004.1 diaminobutyrate--2-oxoglutarate aminotransferase [Paenibacillus dendritiformis C454]CAH8773073.1 diaminobutyrate--2-oxoglutarate transaminase [Paenibacillus dendritiformis]